MYYPLVGLAVYHFIGQCHCFSSFSPSIFCFVRSGPWYIGYLTEGQFGATFLWGSVVGGHYLLPDFQFMIGTFQVLSLSLESCSISLSV